MQPNQQDLHAGDDGRYASHGRQPFPSDSNWDDRDAWDSSQFQNDNGYALPPESYLKRQPR